MQVPLKRTPGTAVVPLEQPYAHAAAPIDVSPIAKPLEGFVRNLKKTKDNLEEFDLRSRLLRETNDLQSDFEQRKDAAPLGDTNFAHQTVQDYETRHNQLVDEYRQRGYSTKALDDFSLRLGALRTHFGEEAIRYQAGSMETAATSQINDFTIQATQYAAKNPITGYTSSLNELRNAVDLLPVDATKKEELYQQGRASVRRGGLEALARLYPGQVITALDPEGRTAPPDVNLTGGAYNVVSAATAQPAAVGGFDAAVEHILGHEGGYNPSDMNGAPVNFGINQKANPDLDVKNLTREQAKQIYYDRYWKPSGAEKLPANMQAPYFDVYIRNPNFAKKALNQSKGDPAEFMRLSSAYFDKLGSTPAGAKYKKAWENRDAHNLAVAMGGVSAPSSAAPASTPSATPPPTSNQSVAPPEGQPTTVGPDGQEIIVTGRKPADFETVRTGISILDDATGAERLQALLQAREEQNRKSTALKSSLDIVVANADAAISLQGGYQGPMPPKETFLQAYGPIEGEQKFAAFTSSLHTNQVVHTIQTLNPTAVQAQVDSLRPDPKSPTLAQDMQRYEAAQRAQAHVMQLRKDDPAAYVLQAFPDIAHQMQSATTSDQRRSAYTAMERAFDQLQIPESDRTYLTNDSRKQMVEQYKTASPQQKLGFIETWLNEMGGRQGRLLHLETDTNQDVAMYRTLSARGGDFRRTFLQVLEGQDIIKHDPARRPSSGAMIAAFTSQPGRIAAINNLSPDVSRMYDQAAAAMYVYHGGRILPNSHGQLSDPKLYDQSLREVMGGSPNNPRTGFVDLGHGKATDHTILPPGVTADEFENWRDRMLGTQLVNKFTGTVGELPNHINDLVRLSDRGLPPTDNRGHPLSTHDLQDQGVFVMIAPGVYAIKMSSDGRFVGDRTGQPFFVHLDRKRMGLH